MSKKLKNWLWLSMVLAVAGALMLYPIGAPALDILFIVIKAGMVAGLLTMLKRQGQKGFRLWAVCSGLAVLMTILKWAGGGTNVFLYLVSMAVDVVMPLYAWKLRQRG